jgi:GNAT superfamily N-acetyltransferase
MTYDIERHPSEIIKVLLRNDAGEQIGRASLVLIVNETNSRPYGLLEDVFVIEHQRRGGHGMRLVQKIVELAKEQHCYKLIATSRYTRPNVHSLYLGIGFRDHGKEFRMDFSD